jgi:hypothetical protein
LLFAYGIYRCAIDMDNVKLMHCKDETLNPEFLFETMENKKIPSFAACRMSIVHMLTNRGYPCWRLVWEKQSLRSFLAFLLLWIVLVYHVQEVYISSHCIDCLFYQSVFTDDSSIFFLKENSCYDFSISLSILENYDRTLCVFDIIAVCWRSFIFFLVYFP